MYVGMGLPSDRKEWYGVVTSCRCNEVLCSLLAVLVRKLKEYSSVDFHMRNQSPSGMKKSYELCGSETEDLLQAHNVGCHFHRE